jgi:ribulose-phosphate 3-epimerase
LPNRKQRTPEYALWIPGIFRTDHRIRFRKYPLLQQVRARIDAHMAAGGQPIWLEVDGGVKADNIGEIVRAGADTCVAGSAVFGAPDAKEAGGGYKDIMQTLRQNAAV